MIYINTLDELKQVIKNKTISLFGAGFASRIIYNYLTVIGVKIYEIMVTNPDDNNNEFQVIKLHKSRENEFVIAAVMERNQPEITKLLTDNGYTNILRVSDDCLWEMNKEYYDCVFGSPSNRYEECKKQTQLIYYRLFDKFIDFENPKTFNEKLQVLKFGQYYNNDLITKCADKYRVREYIKEKGFPEILLELYGVWNRGEDIPFADLPERFALKCNHGSGYNIICDNRDKLDIDNAITKINNWLKEIYCDEFGEIQYLFIEPKVIAEEYIESNEDLKMIKFFCFNGEPRFFYLISYDENLDVSCLTYYDMECNKLPYQFDNYPTDNGLNLDNYNELVFIAKKLSEDFPFVRVDLYTRGDAIRFSELTFIPTGGFINIKPTSVQMEWGNMLEI